MAAEVRLSSRSPSRSGHPVAVRREIIRDLNEGSQRNFRMTRDRPEHSLAKIAARKSRRTTFSAAEDFCYSLHQLKRATLVGEKTGGGAHTGAPTAFASLQGLYF
jgi:hypothetical protein